MTESAARHRAWLAAEDDIRRRKGAAARWPKLLAEIHGVPGLERFALPPMMDELHKTANEGTIVSIIVTEVDCGALLLTRCEVDYLALPALTADDALERANEFLAATEPLGGRPVDTTTFKDVLAWMWDTIAEPILSRLGHTTTPTTPVGETEWPRVWWMPTGPLTVLPLHAAGHHDDPSGARRSVLDRVVSSYTPSVQVLSESRSRAHSEGAGGFAVGLNEAPNMPALSKAEDEAGATGDTLGTHKLLGPAATCEAVKQALGDAAWAHFACHGVANQADPSQSYLRLYDGLMTLRELFTLELRRPYLAFLSACTTAVGSVDLLDENISLSAAFQVAGFPHVIGTMWRIQDYVARDVAADFYNTMLAGPSAHRSPARALHETVRLYRDGYTNSPHFWASHIHHGA